MPIRLRFPGSWPRSRGAAAQAGAGSGARVWAAPLLAICVGLCLPISTGLLASQATTTPPRPAAQAPTPTPLDAAVRDVLQEYSAAFEALDADRIKKIHPVADSNGLKLAFREMRELKVTIDTIKVLSTDGATARVSCRVTQTLTPRAGTKQSNTLTRVMRLRKQDASWVIDGFER